MCIFKDQSKKLKEREKERERERERDRDRETERETKRDRDRDRQTDRNIQLHTCMPQTQFTKTERRNDWMKERKKSEKEEGRKTYS